MSARNLIVCLALVIPAAALAQPATPCTPNGGSWVFTTTAVTFYRCGADGNSWVAVAPQNSAPDWAAVTGKPAFGTASLTAATDYATAAQGTTANSALQPAGNGSALTGLTKTQVGLANVDNTSDANKPVSTATQTALNLKANLASPTFTGTVVVPASTAFTTPVLGVATGTSLAVSGLLTSSSPTAGIGYVAGSGGAQTQATNKATGVASNTVTTAITMNAASLAAGAIVSFTFTNSTIAALDQVICTHQSAGTNGAYLINARPAAGSASVAVRNTTAGALAEAIVLRCSVYKAASS